MSEQRTYITKIGFMQGVRCTLAFYNWWHKVEVEKSDKANATMEMWLVVGKLACQLVPGCMDLNAEVDQKLINLVEKRFHFLFIGLSIYVATFIVKNELGLYCKVDVVLPDSDEWIAWKVEEANIVKDEIVIDLPFQ